MRLDHSYLCISIEPRSSRVTGSNIMLLSFAASGLPGNRFYLKSAVRRIVFLIISFLTVVNKLQSAIKLAFIYDSSLRYTEAVKINYSWKYGQ